MRIEIDQSGKIEETSRSTYIGFSNSKKFCIRISGGEKKILQRFFRQQGQRKLFVVLTFSALIYLMIKNEVNDEIELFIDREYPGYDIFVKNKLVELAQKDQKILNRSQIHIVAVGKKSPSHEVVYRAFISERFNKNIYARDVLKLVGTKQKSGST